MQAVEDDLVWVEGEAAVASNAKSHPWYSEAIKRDMLSGDNWLSTFDGPEEVIARYEVTMAKAGSYTLWLRMNPIAAKVAWRVGDHAWAEVDASKALDQVNLANDNKPDLRFVAWVNGGKVDVPAGKIAIEIKFHSDLNHHGALDCFVLAAKTFHPNGKTKPGSKLGGADPGWWTFEPEHDEFTSASKFTLRGLNEKRAGESGPLKTKGSAITLGNGTPVRFWAVNAGAPTDQGQADYLAARLAKNGFNLTRIHGAVFDRSGADPKAIDLKHLDAIHYAVKAYAEQGIYVHLSTYFPLWLQLKDSDGITDGPLGKNPFALLLIDSTFQDLYKAWLKTVLTTKNPYTGMSLAADPAVGFVEIQNEDSFFFWTFNPENVGKGPWRQLEQKFATWADARYGSRAKVLAAWKNATNPADTSDHLGVVGAYDMTAAGYNQADPGRQARIRDQVRFLAQLQRDFYATMRSYINKDLGFNGLVTASNWTTADNRQLGFIERWTYTGTDVIDRHGYFGGKHEGDNSGWSVRAGHTYEDKAAVLDPTDTPLGYFQFAGKPHILTEVAWNKPNRFVADADLLLSSYGALQGVAGSFLFATSSGEWNSEGSSNWQFMMPSAFGQSPAAALQFRRGDLTPAPVVVREVVTSEDLFTFKAGGFIEGQNADFRIGEAPKAASVATASTFDPLTYFVGRVERTVDDHSAKPVATNLSPFIDRNAKTVRSATGQLTWNWGAGFVTVNSPKSQAVTGFLSKAGTVKLGDVTITSTNDYGTIHVISLDGLPLATSKQILVQSFTEEKHTGWQTNNGTIVDIGHAPIQVKDITATVTFANFAGLKATSLDGHGYLQGDAAIVEGSLTLPKNALYVLITR